MSPPLAVEAWVAVLREIARGFPGFDASAAHVDQGGQSDPVTIAEDLGLLLIPVTAVDGIPRAVPIVSIDADGYPRLVEQHPGWAVPPGRTWLVAPRVDGRRLRAAPRWVAAGWFRAIRFGLVLQVAGLLLGTAALQRSLSEPAWTNLAVVLALLGSGAATLGIGHAVAQTRSADWAGGVGWFARTALVWDRLTVVDHDDDEVRPDHGPGNIDVTLETAVRILSPTGVSVLATTFAATAVTLWIDPLATPFVAVAPVLVSVALILSVPSIARYAGETQRRADAARTDLAQSLAGGSGAWTGNERDGGMNAVRDAALETIRSNGRSRTRALPIIALAAAFPVVLVMASAWVGADNPPGDQLAILAVTLASGVASARLLTAAARAAASMAPLAIAWRELRDRPVTAGPGRRASLERELRYAWVGCGTPGDAHRPLDLVVGRGKEVQIVARDPVLLDAFCRVTLGLTAPSTGRILIDGEDLAGLDGRFYRRGTAMIPADLRLPTGDLADVFAVDSELDWSGRTALLAEFGVDLIVGRLPLGWATPISDGGRWMDAADRLQLLTVRALLTRPTLFVVDRALDRFPPDLVETFVQRVRDPTRILILTTTRQEGIHPGLDLAPLDAVGSATHDDSTA